MADFRFEELGKERTFLSPELQSVAKGSPWTEHRKQYKVFLEDSEVAYLDFDFDRPEGNVLYLIYVAKDFRNQGIGSECLRFAIKLTEDLERPRLIVWPRAFEGEVRDRKKQKERQKKLEQWYKDRGFKPMRGKEFIQRPRLLAITMRKTKSQQK